MSLALALFQPDIAPNTGTMLRLGACLGAPVHIIHPTGFPFSRAALRRGGLDYLDDADMIEHVNFTAFEAWRTGAGRRLVLLTTTGSTSAYHFAFSPDDVILMGRESAGVPPEVAQCADEAIRIPMRAGMRSLNVALAAAMILGEAGRQTRMFEGLS